MDERRLRKCWKKSLSARDAIRVVTIVLTVCVRRVLGVLSLCCFRKTLLINVKCVDHSLRRTVITVSVTVLHH